ncbi:hypothetical protein [Promicromonospora umidemergens]|uniref:Uncharacterized protein n=1 Tax=Promicromonospora umidemergens TaxID=629679 RepID=A0ABP8WWI2_9MICO|nr:hypothetical protein [Promicromonospora umidemergens]
MPQPHHRAPLDGRRRRGGGDDRAGRGRHGHTGAPAEGKAPASGTVPQGEPPQSGGGMPGDTAGDFSLAITGGEVTVDAGGDGTVDSDGGRGPGRHGPGTRP